MSRGDERRPNRGGEPTPHVDREAMLAHRGRPHGAVGAVAGPAAIVTNLYEVGLVAPGDAIATRPETFHLQAERPEQAAGVDRAGSGHAISRGASPIQRISWTGRPVEESIKVRLSPSMIFEAIASNPAAHAGESTTTHRMPS